MPGTLKYRLAAAGIGQEHAAVTQVDEVAPVGRPLCRLRGTIGPNQRGRIAQFVVFQRRSGWIQDDLDVANLVGYEDCVAGGRKRGDPGSGVETTRRPVGEFRIDVPSLSVNGHLRLTGRSGPEHHGAIRRGALPPTIVPDPDVSTVILKIGGLHAAIGIRPTLRPVQVDDSSPTVGPRDDDVALLIEHADVLTSVGMNMAEGSVVAFQHERAIRNGYGAFSGRRVVGLFAFEAR